MSEVIVVPNCLTKAETCRRLNLNLKSVQRLIREGRLKTINPLFPQQHNVVLESSVNEMIRSMTGDISQAG